jgi:hypothetical protein
MPRRVQQPEARRSRPVTSRDLEGMLEVLDGGDCGLKVEVLTDLCPCRNRRYDRPLWAAIFRAYHTTRNRAVRDQADHAIQTLLQRAPRDPRTQELLRWLSEQGVSTLPLEASIPVWNPRPRSVNGIPIPPRPSRSTGHRSRSNRRR